MLVRGVPPPTPVPASLADAAGQRKVDTPAMPAPTPDDALAADARAAEDALAAGARAVVERLRGAGFAALWAGGAVRDQVMGLAPKDYDIATDAEPEQVAALFERSVPVGAQFGILRVIHAGHEYEVARFRAEGPREDALHRDFTLNGLLYDPVADELIDHVGGLADIAARRLRACGGDPEGRFGEDWLRILRGVRFAARFDLAIEPRTWVAMAREAQQVLSASAERRRDELSRILTEGAGGRGFALLAELGLDRALLPEVSDPARARARLERLGAAAEDVGWAVLGYDWGDPAETAAALGRRLKLPTRLARRIGAIVALARALPGYPALTVAQRKRWTRDEASGDALRVAAIAVAANQAPAAGWRAATEDAGRWSPGELRPAALVDGRDLAAAGHAPGPIFKLLLDAIEDAQLEGHVRTRPEALALAERLAGA